MRLLRRIAPLAVALVMTLPTLSGAEPAGAHRFSFVSIEGDPLPLAGFAGKALLLVNTASFCGYTPQYEGLEALWERYRERGLVVLGVPSNDFGAQEPGSAEEIKRFCEVNYAIDFPLTEKVVVKGAAAHPFYRWAAEELGAEAAPRWNFHKYLVAPDGRLAGWFPTRTEPDDPRVLEAIEALLPTIRPGS
ncbi:MAG: glutathione peroxidase [Kiloniellales bacterium]